MVMVSLRREQNVNDIDKIQSLIIPQGSLISQISPQKAGTKTFSRSAVIISLRQ
jgi:hypothetical protein